MERACGKPLEKMEDKAAELLRARYAADVSGAVEPEFDGDTLPASATGESVTLRYLVGVHVRQPGSPPGDGDPQLSRVLPPPFMAGAVEIELDKETGHVEILDYAAAYCGTVINPNLARVQTEGGIVPGNWNGLI